VTPHDTEGYLFDTGG